MVEKTGMIQVKSPHRNRMLCGTALFGAVSLCFATPVWAQCAPSVPTSGQAVTCAGADTTGISGGAENVTVTGSAIATLSTGATSAIDLGNGADIQFVYSNLRSATSDTTTLSVGGGSVTVSNAASITSTTGTAIQFTGTAGTNFAVSNSGIITGVGTAIDYGESRAVFSLGTTGSVTGNVVAGAGTTDVFNLSGTGSNTFNLDEIGTKYNGFEQFQKINSSSWTLTGTGNQNWNISQGTLTGDTTSIQGNVAISSGSGLVFSQNSDGTYNGTISGTGTLTKSGSGTITLTGTNTHAYTSISAGALSISSDANLGSGGSMGMNGGTLISTATTTVSKNIGLGASGGTMSNSGSTQLTLSGILSGAGSLTKSGTGTLTLTGANTYTGGTVVSGGVLRGTTSSIQGDIINNGRVEFTNTSSSTYNGIMSGTGILRRSGTGILTLTGANTYSGGTEVFNGAIAVSAESNLGDVSGELTLANATVRYDTGFSSARNVVLSTGGGYIDTNGNNITLQGSISGSSGLTKTGNGVLRLSGNNTYSGGTSIAAGTLRVTTSTLPGNVSVSSGAYVNFDQGGFVQAFYLNSAQELLRSLVQTLIREEQK
jgi:fibronectin-binding autotransporter adhesin